MTERELATYLHFGYVPTVGAAASLLESLPLPREQAPPPSHRRRQDLVAEGVTVLESAFDRALDRYSSAETHVVPLSGGVDSRVILGALLKRLDPRQIRTVTVGAPGALDFDIARAIADRLGLEISPMDLRTVEWRRDDLVRFARACDGWIPLFEAYLFHQTRLPFGPDVPYWTGFLGDPLSGSHLLRTDSGGWDEAVRRFAQRERFSRSTDLTPVGFDPMEALPARAPWDSESISRDEEIDFYARQAAFIRPLVLHPGYRYETPFLDPEWVRFITSVPRDLRVRQRLYREVVTRAYPSLFELPTKTNFGAPLAAPAWRVEWRRWNVRAHGLARRLFRTFYTRNHPMTNYLDFDRSLRCDTGLKHVAAEGLRRLQRSDAVDWVDVESLWRAHQNGSARHARALELLTSVELFLSAGGEDM